MRELLKKRSMRELLKKNNVQLYSTQNEEKLCIVERWNRTIKRNMWKYFTANNTTRYIDVLPAIIKKYKTTYHRSIKGTPTFARKPLNYQHVFEALYGKVQPATPPKYKVGDRVRIVKKKKTFEKGVTPNCTGEVFTISKETLQTLLLTSSRIQTAKRFMVHFTNRNFKRLNKKFIE